MVIVDGWCGSDRNLAWREVERPHQMLLFWRCTSYSERRWLRRVFTGCSVAGQGATAGASRRFPLRPWLPESRRQPRVHRRKNLHPGCDSERGFGGRGIHEV